MTPLSSWPWYDLDDYVVKAPSRGFSRPVPDEAASLAEILEGELRSDAGTPEWRAWVKRAAARHLARQLEAA